VRRRLADPAWSACDSRRCHASSRTAHARACEEGVQPLTTAQRRAATKAVLAASKGELAASARRSSSTTQVVAGVFAELDDADANVETLLTLAPRDAGPRRLAALYRSYLELVADAARPRPARRHRPAEPHQDPADRLLPRRLTPVELRFCSGMAEQGRLHIVVGLRARSVPTPTPGRSSTSSDRTSVVPVSVAGPTFAQTKALPDAEEEARYGVRRVLAHLAQTPQGAARPRGNRLPGDALCRLVAEQLLRRRAAHHAPSSAHSPRRFRVAPCLGLLPPARRAVVSSRCPQLAAGRAHPRRARLLAEPPPGSAMLVKPGITRGRIEQWREKLEPLATKTEWARVEEGVTWPAERATQMRALAAFVTDSATCVEEIANANSWADAAKLLRSALDHYLGGAQAAAGWAEIRRAHRPRSTGTVRRGTRCLRRNARGHRSVGRPGRHGTPLRPGLRCRRPRSGARTAGTRGDRARPRRTRRPRLGPGRRRPRPADRRGRDRERVSATRT